VTASETEIIAPLPTSYTLSNGLEVDVQPLKTRQFFRLLKIITRGAAPILGEMTGGLLSGNDEDVAGSLIGLIVFAIPEAENEAIEFLNSMILPSDLESSRDKGAQARNNDRYDKLAEAMLNPELDDTIGLIELIIRREASDLTALGKRLVSMLALAEKTGQLDPTSPSSNSGSKKQTPTDSSEASPEPSTPSSESTDGQMTISLTAPLEESDKSSQLSSSGG